MSAEKRLENSPFSGTGKRREPEAREEPAHVDEAAMALLRSRREPDALERAPAPTPPAEPPVREEGDPARWRNGTDKQPRRRKDGAVITRFTFSCTVAFKAELSAFLDRLPPGQRMQWLQEALRAAKREAER